MATDALSHRETNELVLQFDLVPGAYANAEIAAQSFLAWLAATKTAAEILDPYSELRIGLMSAEEGSLRWRTAFEFVENRIVGPPADFLAEFPRIKKLAVATVIGIPAGLAIVVGEHTLYPDRPQIVLSAPAQEQYDEGQRKVQDHPKVQREVRRFFRSVERDPAIEGVSVREAPKAMPLLDVKRDEFPVRSGLFTMQEPPPPTRQQWAVWDVIVTHPVLLSKPKPWRFVREGLPFTATMADEGFLRQLAAGTLPLHIQEGVSMRVRVEWEERLDGQAWTPVPNTRQITKVELPGSTRESGTLF